MLGNKKKIQHCYSRFNFQRFLNYKKMSDSLKSGFGCKKDRHHALFQERDVHVFFYLVTNQWLQMYLLSFYNLRLLNEVRVVWITVTNEMLLKTNFCITQSLLWVVCEYWGIPGPDDIYIFSPAHSGFWFWSSFLPVSKMVAGMVEVK